MLTYGVVRATSSTGNHAVRSIHSFIHSKQRNVIVHTEHVTVRYSLLLHSLQLVYCRSLKWEGNSAYYDLHAVACEFEAEVILMWWVHCIYNTSSSSHLWAQK